MIEKIFAFSGVNSSAKKTIDNLERKKTIDSLEGKKYLLELSIGPSPKKFISESRKLRDTAVSSFLLSIALRWLLDDILQAYDQKAVLVPNIGQEMPAIKEVDSQNLNRMSWPNRCVLLLDKQGLQKIEDCSFKEFCGKLGDIIFSKLSDKVLDKVLKDRVCSQIKNIFSFIWVAVPLDDNDFKEKLQELQKLTMQRKITRNFTFWEGEMGKKCKVCFQREAIAGTGDLKRNFRRLLKDKEELCSICLLKRTVDVQEICTNASGDFQERIQKFPSVSSVCAETVTSLLDNTDEEKLLNIFKDDELTFNCELLYPETYASKESLKEEANIELDNWTTDQKKQALETVKNICNKNGIDSPPSYYVALRFDADDMGKWMSGEFHDQFKQQDLTTMSQQLRFLADVVFPIVIEEVWRGKIIFCSGDELLAFGPMWIKTANKWINFLDIACLIERCFREGQEALQQYCNKEKFQSGVQSSNRNGFRPTNISNKQPTISCGMVVVHKKTPLKAVLKQVYSAENFAKSKSKEKSCWALSVDVRSGSLMKIRSKWSTAKQVTTITSINKLLSYFADKNIHKRYSNNFIRELIELSIILKDFSTMPVTKESYNNQCHSFLFEVFKQECDRLIDRHKSKNSTDKEQEEICSNVINILQHIIKYNAATAERNHVETWLSVITFLTRQQKSLFLGEE